MSKKPKFNPVITKVKLNPEQAVLFCSCYNTGVRPGKGWSSPTPLCTSVIGSKQTVPNWTSLAQGAVGLS